MHNTADIRCTERSTAHMSKEGQVCTRCFPVKAHSSLKELVDPDPPIKPSPDEVVLKVNLKERNGDQKLPVTNDEESCQSTWLARVNEDMPAREKVGIERYGTALQPMNGRDFIRDGWEEYLDLGVYFEGIRRENEELVDLVRSLASTLEGQSEQRCSEAAQAARETLTEMGK